MLISSLDKELIEYTNFIMYFGVTCEDVCMHN